MLAQTCPMTTLAVVNVDAVGRPAAPGVHDGRRRTPATGPHFGRMGFSWHPVNKEHLPEPMWVADSTELKIIAKQRNSRRRHNVDSGQRRYSGRTRIHPTLDHPETAKALRPMTTLTVVNVD